MKKKKFPKISELVAEADDKTTWAEGEARKGKLYDSDKLKE